MTSQCVPQARLPQARRAFQKHYLADRGILLLWQTFQREEGLIHQCEGAERGKQAVFAECGAYVAAETFQDVGQRSECTLKATRFENSLR